MLNILQFGLQTYCTHRGLPRFDPLKTGDSRGQVYSSCEDRIFSKASKMGTKRKRVMRVDVNWRPAIINGCEKSMILRGQQINAHVIAPTKTDRSLDANKDDVNKDENDVNQPG